MRTAFTPTRKPYRFCPGVYIDVLGPAEGSLFETLGDDPVTGAIKVEDFDEVASFVGEEEGGSAGRVDFDGLACDLGEAVEGLAHVAGVQEDVDFEVPVEGKHGDEVSAGTLAGQ